MSKDAEHTRVIGLISGIINVPAAEIGVDMDLRNDLNIDSLLSLQIVAAIESEFDVTLPEDEISNCRTVRIIVDTIERLRAG